LRANDCWSRLAVFRILLCQDCTSLLCQSMCLSYLYCFSLFLIRRRQIEIIATLHLWKSYPITACICKFLYTSFYFCCCQYKERKTFISIYICTFHRPPTEADVHAHWWKTKTIGIDIDDLVFDIALVLFNV